MNVNFVIAKDQEFKIKFGNATFTGAIPLGRTSRAPDLLYKNEVDVCNWNSVENKSKKYDSLTILRKVWEFKRPFKKPSGGLVFTISVVNNERFGKDHKAYFDWLYKERVKTIQKISDNGYKDHNYTPPANFKEYEKNGNQWFYYSSNFGESRFYRLMLNDKIMLRVNIVQFNDNKDAINGQWHPRAELLAKTIIDNIVLYYPEKGELCGCINI